MARVGSGAVYKDWLDERGEAFRNEVQVATLDPFHGYKNAIDDRLEDPLSPTRAASPDRAPVPPRGKPSRGRLRH